MTQLNATSLLTTLRSNQTVSGAAGETKLDMLVREALHSDNVLTELTGLLADVTKELTSSNEWHALQSLVHQLDISNRKLGETIVARINSNEVTGEAALWAAFSGVFLGATLKTETLSTLEPLKKSLPVQWFNLIRDTQAVNFVDSSFISLAQMKELQAQQAVELVRGYKLWATENRIKSWNVTISNFLGAFPDDVEKTVSAKLTRLLGPSFAVETMSTLNVTSGHFGSRTVVFQSLYQRPKIKNAMDRIAAGLDSAHSRALEAAA